MVETAPYFATTAPIASSATSSSKWKNDGVANAAAVQIVSGLLCIGLQVFLFAYYHDDDNGGENIHDTGALFTLAVGSFGVLAGLFGSLRSDFYSWVNYMYFATSLGVVCSSIIYFLSGYWNFYSSLKSSFYYLVVSDDYQHHEYDLSNSARLERQQVIPGYDDLHFWLKAASFLSVVVMMLFSLAALAVVCSDRCCSRTSRKSDDYKILLANEIPVGTQ